jgi:hypothetical protein
MAVAAIRASRATDNTVSTAGSHLLALVARTANDDHMRIALQYCAFFPLAALSFAQEEQPRALQVRTEGATAGYTLFAPLQSGSTFLVDLDGEVVHEWKTEFGPGNAVYLLPNANLLRCVRVEDNAPFRGGGIGGRLQELAPDGSVVWDYSLATEGYHHHHDVEPLPNGNVLAIVWERLCPERAAELGRDPLWVEGDGWWVDAVLEIEPVRPDGGKIVWRWSSADHLIQDFSEEAAGFGEVPLHPERIDVNADHRDRPPETLAQKKAREEMERKMRALGYVGGDDDDEDKDARPQGGRGGSDWMHTNSIDYHEGLDLIVLSVRSLDEIWVIDHSTSTEEAAGTTGGDFSHGGDLLYRWGNPRTYGIQSAQQLFGQHDATWVEGPNGAPRIMVFNNGSGRPGDVSFSSVIELELPFDPESGFERVSGQAFAPAGPAWVYTAPEKSDFFSSFISGAQRLASGNTLIASGSKGRVFEVTREGEIVWEYVNPHGGDLPIERGGRGRRGGPGDRGPDGRGPDRRGPDDRGPDDRGRPDDRGPAGDRRPPGPPGARRGGGGPGGMAKGAMFRATRLAPDHPGVKGLLAEER